MTESTSKKSAAKKNQSRRSTAKSRRLNRAQQRAMAVRAAETNVRPEPVVDDVVEVEESPSPTTRLRSARASRRRGSRPVPQKTITLTKEQEYAFIRSDLRRMILTAGSLLGLMVVLLFVFA